MIDIVIWIMKIILGLVLLQYIAGPLIIYFSQRLPEKYEFKLIDSHTFLSNCSEVYLEIHEKLESLGFNYAGSSVLELNRVTMNFSIYTKKDEDLLCTLSSSITAHPKFNTVQLEFTNLFLDGSALNINNNPLPDTFSKNKMKTTFRFPNVNDVDGLLSRFRKIASSDNLGKAPLAIPEGKEFQKFEAFLNRELKWLIETGWVSQKVVNSNRSLTVKGALLMTWMHCWPVNAIRGKLEELKSENAYTSL